MINSRIIHKHDTEANWNKATGFSPLQGEIIVYDKDENYDYERFKIGDGSTIAKDLPFASFSGKWEDLEGKPFTTQSIEGTTSALSEDFEIYNVEVEEADIYIYYSYCNGDINVIENKQYAVYINANRYLLTAKHYYEYEDVGESEQPLLVSEYLYLGENRPIIRIPIRNSEVSIDEVTITTAEEITNFQVYPYEEIDIINEDSIPDTIARVDDIPEGITAEDVSNQIAAAAIRYDEAQNLTDDEKTTARENVGIDFTWIDEQISNDRLANVTAGSIGVMDSEWSYGVSFIPQIDEFNEALKTIGVIEATHIIDSEAAGVRIRGLAAGAEDTDAVNVKQLNNAIADAKSYIDETILGGAW